MYEQPAKSLPALSTILLGLLAVTAIAADQPTQAAGNSPVASWRFETIESGVVRDSSGELAGKIAGAPELISGVEGQALKLDGQGDYVTVPSADAIAFADGDFSISAWVNVYALDRGQQMIVAKNVYSANQREWGLMVDADNRWRFYLWDQGWKTVDSQTASQPGHWTHVAVTVERGTGRLYVNGRPEGQARLAPSVPATEAPLTIGAVNNGGRLMQMFLGAIDEVSLFRGVLTPAEIRTMADKATSPHKIEIPELVKIWSGGPVPNSAEIPVLPGVEFHVIKPYEFSKDGYRFLHGVALAWHKGRLYASFGHNRGGENTDTEEARGCVSDDGGRTWSDVCTIDSGQPGLGVSHGVFLSHQGSLWAFHGAYRGIMDQVHTRAYVLDEPTGHWQARGVVVEGGFWPMQEPLKMADGNWIMSGARVGDGNPAAVAISRGDDLTKWDLVVIPKAPSLPMWGESSVILDGQRVVNVARHGNQAVALVATSDDFGRTWTPSRPGNLPMVTSKPYTGTLSTGQHYLIATTTADSGRRRSPLTIAVSRPGQRELSRVFVIRHALFPEGPGESHERAALAYPYAVEHGGRLYVGYSNSGGGVGRTGEGRERWNNNSAELAIIPVSALLDEETQQNSP
ncbi:MAG: exo-alpha-sialidase [Pirellulaceae bacterium]|nr:exo-alpha-sialidase [Pirellulaceae bacterium]